MIAGLAATVLVALLLAACGSSDSDSGSSDSSSTGSSATTEAGGQNAESTGGSHGENDAGGGEPGQSEQNSADGADQSSTGFSAEEIETPLKVSGGGAEQFIVKGGDNSIQEFGEESDESELQEAAEVVHEFFVARAVGEWEKACGFLAKSMTERLEQLATSSTSLEDKSCASFLAAFTTKLPASAWREITTIDAGSLRLDGEQAFLIYYGPEKTVYSMPLAVEDGTFKIGGLAGNQLS